MKLKHSEIATYRQTQLIKQGGLCALCKQHILDDAVLDHDHSSGLVRSVLHRGCNSLLGKIENNMKRNRVDVTRLQSMLQSLIPYITHPHTDILHPTHKTAEDRKEIALKKRRLKQQLKRKLS